MSEETKPVTQPEPKPEPAKPHYVLVVQNAKHAPKLSTQEKQNG